MKLRLYVIAWFLFLAIMLAPHFAAAQMLGTINTIGIHTVTHHSPGNGANDINLGLNVTTDKGYLAGGYYNSHHRMSYYAGWETPEWYRMKIGAALVTGYYSPVTFVAVPSLKLYQGDGWSAWVSGSPVKLTPDGQSVLHLSLAWNL